jgi:Skp family chaperone for outer membrane proteins
MTKKLVVAMGVVVLAVHAYMAAVALAQSQAPQPTQAELQQAVQRLQTELQKEREKTDALANTLVTLRATAQQIAAQLDAANAQVAAAPAACAANVEKANTGMKLDPVTLAVKKD